MIRARHMRMVIYLTLIAGAAYWVMPVQFGLTGDIEEPFPISMQSGKALESGEIRPATCFVYVIWESNPEYKEYLFGFEYKAGDEALKVERFNAPIPLPMPGGSIPGSHFSNPIKWSDDKRKFELKYRNLSYFSGAFAAEERNTKSGPVIALNVFLYDDEPYDLIHRDLPPGLESKDTYPSNTAYELSAEYPADRPGTYSLFARPALQNLRPARPASRGNLEDRIIVEISGAIRGRV